MVKKIRIQLKHDRITIVHEGHAPHGLYTSWINLRQLVEQPDNFDTPSKAYHAVVIRARERIYARFGDCSFED